MKNQEIICISTTDWDAPQWGSRQQIMSRLSQNNRILFVNAHAGPENILKHPEFLGKLVNWIKGVRRIGSNIWLFDPPLVFPFRLYSKLMNNLGQMLICFFLKRIVTQLGFTKPVVWTYCYNTDFLIGRFNEKLSVYHCIDNLIGTSKGRKRKIIDAMEKTLLQKVDIVFVNTETHFERIGCYNKSMFLLPSAVDAVAYREVLCNQRSGPEDITTIRHPIIGYAGTIDERFDENLIYNLAKRYSEFNFVLVGQVSKKANINSLKSLHNTHILGYKSPALIPYYIKTMDICLIPYKLNEYTSNASPLKLYEYLAMGKPIVSVDIPAVRQFSEVVAIAKNYDGFAQHIRRCLENDNEHMVKQRLEIAHQNSWNHRISQISRVIESLSCL